MLNNVTRVDKNWQRDRGEDPTACTQQLDEIYDDNALDNASTSSEESCARERERERNGWNIETATKKQKESMSLTDDRGYHGGAGHRSEPESK